MLNILLKKNNQLSLVIFHIFLGFVSTLSKFPVVFYIYLILISSISRIFLIKKDFTYLNLLIIYLIPLEILCRMAETSPFVPYELSKYLMFLLLTFGIFKGKRKGLIGILLLFLLLPALFFDLSGQVEYRNLVFNVLAPINLCLGIIYFYKSSIDSDKFYLLIRAMLFPLISALAYVYIKTPKFETIEFSLSAVHDASGGFGPNQVATIFGLGLFLTFFLINKGVKISGYYFIDIGILFLFAFQGLLSFSRGGMIGGILAIIIFYVSSLRITKVKSKKLLYTIPVFGILLGSFWISNEITGGQLFLRYQGETSGTQAGSKEKDLNTLTTGRSSIFEGDWQLFQENSLGVGAGASSFLRDTERGALTHTEFSRLLAEHGYLGLIFFAVITFLPFYFFTGKYPLEFKGFMLALYFLAWFTTFHAATRNFVAPLLIGLALMRIRPEISETAKNKVAK